MINIVIIVVMFHYYTVLICDTPDNGLVGVIINNINLCDNEQILSHFSHTVLSLLQAPYPKDAHHWWMTFFLIAHNRSASLKHLTLSVRGPSYLGLTRSISWLLMPWLLTSPGHQQPWYWLRRIGRFLSYLRNHFNYLRRINVEKWHKM